LGLDQAPGNDSVNLNGSFTVNASCGAFSNSDLSGGGGGGRRPTDASVPPAREFEQAAAHDRHLSMLAKRQADARRRVEALVITKRPGD